MDSAGAGYRPLLDALPYPTLVVRAADGLVVEANPPAARVLGCDRAVLVGRALSERFVEPAERVLEQVRSAAGSLSPVPGALTPLGGERPSPTTAAAIAGGRPRLVLLQIDPGGRARTEFALLTEKIDALTAEVGRRRLAEQALARAADRLSSMVTAMQRLAEMEPSDASLMTRVVELTQATMSGDGAVYARRSGEDLVCDAASGMATDHLGWRLPLATSFAGAALESDRPLVSADAANDARVVRLDGRELGFGSIMVCRLPGDERAGGVLQVIARTPGAFSAADVDSFALLAEGVAGVLRRRRFQAQLRQAQRLEAVGQLTGGIAHDFNNLLTVVLGNADLLANVADAEVRAQAMLIRDAAERGAALTSRLLAFARRQPLEPEAVDVSRLIVDMEPLVRRAMGEAVDVRFRAAACRWRAMVDPSQLESALLNLCLNARDAMPGGGRLTIETADVELDQDYAEANDGVVPGSYVVVAVSDTGTGMEQPVLARVFEPFFTTKGVGHGSGLGLSMVYGFARQSGGHVKIYSEVGVGTTVRLYLPRVEAGADAARPAPVPTPAVTGGRETVLLVEDDELVRAHAEMLLRSLGYRVLGVGAGRAALDLLRREPTIDLLFTDVVLPGGMNGKELSERARELRPGLPVLFTSGYTEGAMQHQGRLDMVPMLGKPYRRQELASKVRAVLTVRGDEAVTRAPTPPAPVRR